MRSLIVIALLATAGEAVGSAPSPGGRVVMRTADDIERRCRKAEAVRSKPDRVFAEVSDEVMPLSPAGKWREFPGPEALMDAGPDGSPNTQAFVWRFADGVLFVQLFFQSGSGDWSHFADHCFRPDGTLARVRSTLNTFHTSPDEVDDGNEGGVSRIRIKSFDPEGRVLRKASRLVDLITKKPVKRSFMDDEDVIFKRVSDLPFRRLMVEAGSNSPSQTDRTMPAAEKQDRAR